jgi:hypothetical protein
MAIGSWEELYQEASKLLPPLEAEMQIPVSSDAEELLWQAMVALHRPGTRKATSNEVWQALPLWPPRGRPIPAMSRGGWRRVISRGQAAQAYERLRHITISPKGVAHYIAWVNVPRQLRPPQERAWYARFKSEQFFIDRGL